MDGLNAGGSGWVLQTSDYPASCLLYRDKNSNNDNDNDDDDDDDTSRCWSDGPVFDVVVSSRGRLSAGGRLAPVPLSAAPL